MVRKNIRKSKMTMDLPKVGDVLVRLMTKTAFDPMLPYDPEPCVVTYVNEKRSWYQVEFLRSGVKECYNLPIFDHSILSGVKWQIGNIPCVCVETGFVYPSATACAKDMNMSTFPICAMLRGEYDHLSRYHFDTVL